MSGRVRAICTVLLVFLAAGLAVAAEPTSIAVLLADPASYANKTVTISGVVTNVGPIEDPLSEQKWEYTVQDRSGGTIAVRLDKNPPSPDQRVTVTGTLDVSGNTVAILQSGGLAGGVPTPLLLAALAVLVVLAVLLIYMIVRKPSPGRAVVTVSAGADRPGVAPTRAAATPSAATAQEFCEQCGAPKPVGQPCPKCATGKAPTRGKPTTVEVKPESAATQLVQAGPPTLAWLAIREGNRVGKRFDVTEQGETVGRDPSNTISLDDPTVSRNHAKIMFEDGKFLVHDLGSANKTKVNGVEVIRQEIVDGDEVEFGKVRMVFKRA